METRAYFRLVGVCALIANTSASVAHAADADIRNEDLAAGTVIVTGTRDSGKKVRESMTPVIVIGAEDLASTGKTNVLDALKSLVPSLNTPAVGYDVGALARTFQLRGLSPGNTLVLINGKRRHVSASLYADSDPAQGSNAVDLDFIPLAAIDHIEILQDGAAAQYGSDAIAGVINIILKKSPTGTSVSLLGGGYIDGGGQTQQFEANKGFIIAGDGFLNLSFSAHYHGYSNRSGDSGGAQAALVQGDPKSSVVTGAYNFEKPITPDLTFYSFATVAHRDAQANENPRQPDAISPAVNVLYPNGFTPQEKVSENDFGLTAGLKGVSSDKWNWDVSTTYGRDQAKLENIRTVNPDLLNDFGNAQSKFRVGSFTSSELTTNVDVRRPFTLDGLSGPLLVALGLENRYERFQIGAGEANSYYLGGSSAFPGFQKTDQVDATRNSLAAYVDLTAHITSQWELGFATRAEHYQQVGNKVTGKLSTRYDFSPAVALRATLSNGFHAPTLAQQYYSATTVTTGFAQVQLPLGSAGANVLGAPNLKPETSKNISVGLVLEPVKGVHATIDAYQININNRIIESASISGQLAAAAVAANGAAIPAGVPSGSVSAAFFTNGVDTKTQGIDVSIDTISRLGALGTIKWIVNGGYNKTTIEHISAAPAALQAAGLSLVDPVQRSNLTTATPRGKASIAAIYTKNEWELTLRETVYGKTSQVQGYAPGPYFTYNTDVTYITAVDLGYNFSDHLKVNIGADNLLNKYPTKMPASVYQNLNYDQYSHVSPFGVNGAYYYARVSYAF